MTDQGNTPDALYKSLSAGESIDLIVYGGRRGILSLCCPSETKFLEDGRPRELSAVPLSVWSLLTTSIKDYHVAVRKLESKCTVFYLLSVYLVWILSLVLKPDTETLPGFLAFFACIATCVVGGHACRNYVRKHVEAELHPAVHRVVDELLPSIRECGFELEYAVEQGDCCSEKWLLFSSCGTKKYRSYLRFTPLDAAAIV